MLPPDFDFHKHVTRLGGDEGINPSGRWGNHHVKIVDPPEHLVGPGISRFLQLAKVRHPPVSHAFRAGEHLLHAPWTDGVTLSQMKPGDVDRVHVTSTLHTLLGEWLGGIEDRHPGNYLLDSKGHVHSIDQGLTGMGWYHNVLDGPLPTILRLRGVQPSHLLPGASVKHLLDHETELRHAHEVAMAGWDKQQRAREKEMLDSRFKHLRRAGSGGQPVPLSHLFDHP